MVEIWNARATVSGLLAAGVIAAGCTAPSATEAERPQPDTSGAPTPADRAGDPLYDVANPVFEGAELPDGFVQLLPRDGIPPIYDPEHVAADHIEWDDETLVIGAEVNDEARAYPVDHLNRREIVNDTLDGVPILVTW